MVYTLKPDPWSSHTLIFSWLQQYPPGTRILDVGAAAARPHYREVLCFDLEHAKDVFLLKRE